MSARTRGALLAGCLVLGILFAPRPERTVSAPGAGSHGGSPGLAAAAAAGPAVPGPAALAGLDRHLRAWVASGEHRGELAGR